MWPSLMGLLCYSRVLILIFKLKSVNDTSMYFIESYLGLWGKQAKSLRLIRKFLIEIQLLHGITFPVIIVTINKVLKNTISTEIW